MDGTGKVVKGLLVRSQKISLLIYLHGTHPWTTPTKLQKKELKWHSQKDS